MGGCAGCAKCATPVSKGLTAQSLLLLRKYVLSPLSMRLSNFANDFGMPVNPNNICQSMLWDAVGMCVAQSLGILRLMSPPLTVGANIESGSKWGPRGNLPRSCGTLWLRPSPHHQADNIKRQTNQIY